MVSWNKTNSELERELWGTYHNYVVPKDQEVEITQGECAQEEETAQEEPWETLKIKG